MKINARHEEADARYSAGLQSSTPDTHDFSRPVRFSNRIRSGDTTAVLYYVHEAATDVWTVADYPITKVTATRVVFTAGGGEASHVSLADLDESGCALFVDPFIRPRRPQHGGTAFVAPPTHLRCIRDSDPVRIYRLVQQCVRDGNVLALKIARERYEAALAVSA